MAKTPGLAMVVIRLKSIGATPTGLKALPQPGDSGSVGGPVTTPPDCCELMINWVARTPFAVRSWAKRIAGVRLQKRPTEPRTAVFSSGAQERLTRGEMLLLESGILPFSLNEPLAFTSFWLRTAAFGLSRFSQRTPAVTVRLGRTNH